MVLIVLDDGTIFLVHGTHIFLCMLCIFLVH